MVEADVPDILAEQTEGMNEGRARRVPVIGLDARWRGAGQSNEGALPHGTALSHPARVRRDWRVVVTQSGWTDLLVEPVEAEPHCSLRSTMMMIMHAKSTSFQEYPPISRPLTVIFTRNPMLAFPRSFASLAFVALATRQCLLFSTLLCLD